MKIDRQKLASVIRSLDGVDDEVKSQLMGLLNEKKSYGLVWEDKPEDAEAQMCDKLPVLQEVTSRRIQSEDPTAPNHVLIEGDNLHALTSLCYTHEGKIDVIYIDPPYNTGNKDFIYNDSYVDAEDGYRHSKWLSFMYKRLKKAKSLLSDRGVIFISIDDNEQANLKLLCDEVFGERNFITSFPWHSRQSLQNDTDMSVNHEYIVCFAKNRREKDRRLKASNSATWYRDSDFVFYPIQVDNDKYSNPDNDSRGPWKADPFDAPHVRPNLTYPIINPNTGEEHLPPRGRHWRISQEKFVSALNDNRILFGKNGKGRPQLKVFLREQEQYGSIGNSWLEAEKYGTATHGSKELQELFDGEKMFTSPKPTTLIVELLKFVTIPQKQYTILDFFAGSGTTLHATMQLNAEDGGHRQCILVTNNENGICENVTYERNKRVIEGYTTPKGEVVEGLKANNLRYYKTEFVDRERTSRNMRALMKMATDMLCIKEDLYDEVEGFGQLPQKDGIYRHFRKEGKQMLVIYKEDYIEDFIAEIEKMEVTQRIHIYVFSPSNDPFTESFDVVADKVKLVALPAAILEAYKEVLPPKKETLLPEFESQEQTKDEEEKEVTLDNLFD